MPQPPITWAETTRVSSGSSGSASIPTRASAHDVYGCARSWTGRTCFAPAANWISAIASSARRTASQTTGVRR